MDGIAIRQMNAFDGGDGPREEPPARLVGVEREQFRLIYKPRILQKNQTVYRIFGQRDDAGVVPWGFWGGVLIAVMVLLIIVFRGATGIYSMWDLLWAMLAFSVGAVMLKLGARNSLRDELLCEVDAERELLQWPTGGEAEPLVVLPFEEITELVFGMTRYPVSLQRQDVTVHAFTLLVRDDQNRLIPIVEASPNKEETFGIAKFLGQITGQTITTVGLGVK